MAARDLPPIILLLLDTAGAKHFSLYGYGRPTTPHLERLAPDAAVYRHCFSPAPWTLPSHVSLFTGLYPQEHLSNDKFTGLPEGLHTLPEILTEMGYAAVGLSSNPLISPALHFDRGFSKFYEMDTLFHGTRYLETRREYLEAKEGLKNDWEKIKFIARLMLKKGYFSYPLKKALDQLYKKHLAKTTVSTACLTRRSMRLAKKLVARFSEEGRPLFLFINLMETHENYRAPFPFNRKFGRVDSKSRSLKDYEYQYIEDARLRAELAQARSLRYDQEILFTDHLMGDFCDFLTRRGLMEKVVLIVTSDHGEAMGEHGVFGHTWSVYNEVLHIPLIVKYPKDFGVRGEFDRVTQLHDLFATLCQIADSPLPVPFSSRSLLDSPREFALSAYLDNRMWVEALSRRQESFKLWTCMQPGTALISQDLWKLIRWEDGTQELYDLNRDFYEGEDLIDRPECAEKVAWLENKLKETLGGGPGTYL